MKIKDLLALRLHLYIPEIEEITEKAGKEAKHESILMNLEGTWSNAVFSMTVYKGLFFFIKFRSFSFYVIFM